MKKIFYSICALSFLFVASATIAHASSNPYPKTQEWIQGIDSIDANSSKQYTALVARANVLASSTASSTTAASTTAARTAAVTKIQKNLVMAKNLLARGKNEFSVAKKNQSERDLNRTKSTLQAAMEAFTKVATSIKEARLVIPAATSTSSR
jgi:hypothetical protein